VKVRRLVLLGVGVLALLTACSGQSTSPPPPAPTSTKAAPIAGALPGNQVEPAVKTAFQGATAVHISGTLNNGSGALTLDLQLNKDDSASGTVSEGGPSIPLRSVHGVDYMQFTPQVISGDTNPAVQKAGAALTNKWVVGTSSLASDVVNGLKPLLDYNDFLSNMFSTQSQVPQATTLDVVDNTPVIVYEAADGASVYVAKTAPHYLMRLTSPSAGSGQLDFTGWNKPVPVAAPPAAQLYHATG
jgi:hypothetical protein